MQFGAVDSDKHYTGNYSPNEFMEHALFNAGINKAKVKMSFLAV